jgi:ABC-2 type transport system permease protein
MARRSLADARTRLVAFGLLFATLSYTTVAGYRSTYPSAHARLGFAHDFGANQAVRLFYGVPHDLLTDGGYAAWRAGGFLSIFVALWALMAATRALRGEEDSGRQELVLAGPVSRRSVYLGALAAIATGVVSLWLAVFLSLLAARLPSGAAAEIALAAVMPAPVFAGLGAMASQLAPARPLATGMATGALLAAFALRVVADTSTSLGWLRWATPLGWSEELRAATGLRPAVVVLPLVVGAALLGAAGAISLRRDIGSGLLRSHDRRSPRLGLLGSPEARALRDERGLLAGWLAGIGGFALILGAVSISVTSAHIPASAQRQFAKLSATSITTPSGYLGFTFLFFVLAVSLFACSQVAAVRREEAAQQLETLFALPVARGRWLAGRFALAAAGTAAVGLAAGLSAWAGAASQGADVSLGRMLEAGVNCLPTSVLFLGLGLLAFAVAPAASAGIAYGMVSVAFVWELFGGLVSAPAWTLDLSPFHHVGLVPAESLRVASAAAMTAIGLLAAVAAVAVFLRRDLAGA